MKVAVFFENLGPYHVARLNAASRVCDILGVEWRHRSHTYGWDSVGYGASFKKHTLLPANQERSDKGNLRTILKNQMPATIPDAVAVNGWGDFGSLDTIWWASQQRLPIIVMSESTAWDEPRKPWKELIKRRIVKLFSAALVGGSAQRDYLLQLGMRSDRIFLGYDAVDNSYFADKAAAIRKEGKPNVVSKSDAEHSAFAIPNSPFFLSSARFVEKKNLFRLIEAYAEYRKLRGSQSAIQNGGATARASGNSDRPDSASASTWDLVLLGDGELRGELIARAQELGLVVVESAPWKQSLDARQSRLCTIFMPGFIQYTELPEYYGRAGAFIHASTTEQWGLVVNEAMASGLPVIVSNRCGCARDLVAEGVNGFTFDPYCPGELIELMSRVSDASFPISTFSMESSRVISQWGPERFSSGLKAAAEMATEAGPAKATLLQRALLDFLIKR